MERSELATFGFNTLTSVPLIYPDITAGREAGKQLALDSMCTTPVPLVLASASRSPNVTLDFHHLGRVFFIVLHL